MGWNVISKHLNLFFMKFVFKLSSNVKNTNHFSQSPEEMRHVWKWKHQCKWTEQFPRLLQRMWIIFRHYTDLIQYEKLITITWNWPWNKQMFIWEWGRHIYRINFYFKDLEKENTACIHCRFTVRSDPATTVYQHFGSFTYNLITQILH